MTEQRSMLPGRFHTFILLWSYQRTAIIPIKKNVGTIHKPKRNESDVSFHNAISVQPPFSQILTLPRK